LKQPKVIRSQNLVTPHLWIADSSEASPGALPVEAEVRRGVVTPCWTRPSSGEAGRLHALPGLRSPTLLRALPAGTQR